MLKLELVNPSYFSVKKYCTKYSRSQKRHVHITSEFVCIVNCKHENLGPKPQNKSDYLLSSRLLPYGLEDHTRIPIRR